MTRISILATAAFAMMITAGCTTAANTASAEKRINISIDFFFPNRSQLVHNSTPSV